MAFTIDFPGSYDKEGLATKLRRIALKTGRNTMTTGDTKRLGTSTVLLKFGTINKANEAAGGWERTRARGIVCNNRSPARPPTDE